MSSKLSTQYSVIGLAGSIRGKCVPIEKVQRVRSNVMVLKSELGLVQKASLIDLASDLNSS